MDLKNRIIAVFVVGAVSVSYMFQPAMAENKQFSRPEIELIVRDYLLKNPELLVEMSRLLEAKRKALTENNFSQGITKLKAELVSGNGAAVMGNPDGKTVVIEFSDYNCPYCKRMAPMVKQAIKGNPDLKFVLREFPILGPSSRYASAAALAAKLQGKYETAHFALISTKGRLTETKVNKLLAVAGLDMEKLKKDIESPTIKTAIARNLEIGQMLGINGTPAFIAAEKLFPGALTSEQFSNMVQTAKP